VSTFVEIVHRRERRRRAQRFNEQRVANAIAWREIVPIENLSDPSGGPLFGGFVQAALPRPGIDWEKWRTSWGDIL
jgi:hypothetical protein